MKKIYKHKFKNALFKNCGKNQDFIQKKITMVLPQISDTIKYMPFDDIYLIYFFQSHDNMQIEKQLFNIGSVVDRHVHVN